jgi:hypothetical protein
MKLFTNRSASWFGRITPCLLVLCLFFLVGCEKKQQVVTFQTEYQGVFLATGQTYFGKAKMGPDYITLEDVFYIRSQVNQETKETSNILIKRGKELHGPDMMYINKDHVVLIEPVSPDSEVGKLIKEAKAQKPAETK